MRSNGQKSLFSAEYQKTINQNFTTLKKSYLQQKTFVRASGRSNSLNTVTKGGFTLFEVSISLAIVAFAVVSVLMLFPTGIKMQSQARYQLLASVKALELVEYFSSKPNHERVADFETPLPWEARPFCYTSTRWDMENRMARYDSGVMPVPMDIARRLDSENNEIAEVLAQGGYLYYADPRVIPGIEVDLQYLQGAQPANETHKLVFAVAGAPQNNAMQVFPYKAWPYRDFYPSPPTFSSFNKAAKFQAEKDFSVDNVFPNYDRLENPPGSGNFTFHDRQFNAVCLEGWNIKGIIPVIPSERDDDVKDIFLATVAYETEARKLLPKVAPYNNNQAEPTPADRQTKISAVREALVLASLKYCKNKLGSEYSEYIEVSTSPADFTALGKKYDLAFDGWCRAAESGSTVTSIEEDNRNKVVRHVLALRYLAFAMGTYEQQRNGESLTNFTNFKPLNIPITKERLRYYQERSLYFVNRYAAYFPYDWGAPRNVTRSIMMDNPLMEWDLFSPPLTGNIRGTTPTPGVSAAMWRPISAQTITNIGLPAMFPGKLNPSGFSKTTSPFEGADPRVGAAHPLWGNAQNFSLTQPFEAAERCRQLVFWAVDWQSYVDAETAPSAPLDASRSPLRGLNANTLTQGYDVRLSLNPNPVDGLHWRNPEREFLFLEDMTSFITGSSTKNYMIKSWGDSADMSTRERLSGLYGADRNRNYKLDRGTVPKSVRQRANFVSRFLFYDSRLPTTLK